MSDSNNNNIRYPSHEWAREETFNTYAYTSQYEPYTDKDTGEQHTFNGIPIWRAKAMHCLWRKGNDEVFTVLALSRTQPPEVKISKERKLEAMEPQELTFNSSTASSVADLPDLVGGGSNG